MLVCNIIMCYSPNVLQWCWTEDRKNIVLIDRKFHEFSSVWKQKFLIKIFEVRRIFVIVVPLMMRMLITMRTLYTRNTAPRHHQCYHYLAIMNNHLSDTSTLSFRSWYYPFSHHWRQERFEALQAQFSNFETLLQPTPPPPWNYNNFFGPQYVCWKMHFCKKNSPWDPPWDLENNNLGGVVASYNLELMIINEPFPYQTKDFLWWSLVISMW